MTEQYVSSAISIEIPSFSEKYVDGKTITFYNVNVSNNFTKQKWTLDKRYSEFEYLHRNISKIFPNIPPIPGKSVFKITSYDALLKRRLSLEVFLKACTERKDILSNDSFTHFLEMDKHSTTMTVNPPTKVYEYVELPLGVRDFYYYKDKNLLLVVCCDMNIASRVDAYITNVNLPWEKKTDAHISVGAAFAFRAVPTKESYYFERLWAKSFPEQTGVVNFDIESGMLQIGLDSGAVVFYQTSEETKFTTYEETCNIKPHKGRVMGIAYNHQQGYIYSCSTDKRCCLSEINYQSTAVEIAHSDYGYTALEYDKVNSRLFLTNEGGILSVFSTTAYPPCLLTVVKTNTSNTIRGLHIDYKKLYIFTATNKGNISVLNLGQPGKEKLISEISYFGGNVEIRIVRYDSIKNELITGDQVGKVTIWSLKTGQSIYAWQAHASAITQMNYDENQRTLLTMSKDKKITFWKFPQDWMNEDLKQFEQNEIKNINDTLALLKMQKTLSKHNNDDDDDSSDDSLNGWDIRA